MCMGMNGCSCVVQADKHAPLSKLLERFPFAPKQDTSAKATKATKRWQGGRRHKQPAPDLFLQSTVKIPEECSYHIQSITT